MNKIIYSNINIYIFTLDMKQTSFKMTKKNPAKIPQTARKLSLKNKNIANKFNRLNFKNYPIIFPEM